MNENLNTKETKNIADCVVTATLSAQNEIIEQQLRLLFDASNRCSARGDLKTLALITEAMSGFITAVRHL